MPEKERNLACVKSLEFLSSKIMIIRDFIRDLIEVIPEWSSSFPYFLQFKSEFGNKEFMIKDIYYFEKQHIPSIAFISWFDNLNTCIFLGGQMDI